MLGPALLQECHEPHVRRGEDADFHKATEFLVPLEPPYGVVDLGTERAYYATFTLGGLDTTPDGTVVPGLFAAGRTTAGIARGGYVSGISLGDGIREHAGDSERTERGRKRNRDVAHPGHVSNHDLTRCTL